MKTSKKGIGVQLQKEEVKGGWAGGVEEAGTRDRALSTDREGLVDGMQWAPRPREWVRAKYANC